MKKFKLLLGSAGLFMLPFVVSAQLIKDSAGEAGDNAGPLQDLLTGILNFTNTFLIPFIIAIGFLVFVWGMFQYFIAGGANDESKEKGKSLMIWATVGFVMIIIFWGVINLLTASTGLDAESVKSTPTIVIPGGTT